MAAGESFLKSGLATTTAVSSPPAAAAPPDFRGLYQAQFKFVWRAVQRLGATPHELEDRVHDVFAIVVRRWDTFDPNRSLRLWLYGIAYRVMLDHRRKLGNQETPVAVLPLQTADDDPERATERGQGLSIARQIIDSMELDRKTVLVMHDLEELPMAQIALELDIPVNTAYSRLRLARREFDEKANRLMSRGKS